MKKNYQKRYKEEYSEFFKKNICRSGQQEQRNGSSKKDCSEKDICIAQMIFDHLSDGYDDEEYREVVDQLREELSLLSENAELKGAIVQLCRRVKELGGC